METRQAGSAACGAGLGRGTIAAKSIGAMLRFNQAWLLNPKNYSAFWGFGAVLSEKRQARRGDRVFGNGA